MTIAEAAKVLGVNPMTVRRWIRGGKLKALKETIQGVEQWAIDEADLDAVAESRASSPQTPERVKDEGAAVLAERVHGLEQLVQQLKEQVTELNATNRALLTTNARLADQNAELQALALPARKEGRTERKGFWARFGKRSDAE